MLNIIDTHCHLIDEAYETDQDQIIQNAVDAGVGKMVVACCDNKEFRQILSLCEKYPGTLFTTIGIHPENLAEDIELQLTETELLLEKYRSSICAVGEIGLDLHWDKSRLDEQKEVLARQVFLAVQHDLPVLLHVRDAMPEFLTLLRNIYDNIEPLGLKIRGILHCYSGTIEEAEEAMTMGDFLLGIGGTVTYKKSLVPDIVKHFGLDKIVLETDAPYLAPVPHRGQRNEPAYTADVAYFIAKLLDCSIEEVSERTTQNALNLLRF